MTIQMGTTGPAQAPADRPAPTRPERCPVEHWLDFLGHRWNALILWHLQEAPLRHRDLQARLVGVTSKVLAERVSELRARGLVERAEQASFPRAVTYRLSDRGRSLLPVLQQLEAWAAAEGSKRPIGPTWPGPLGGR